METETPGKTERVPAKTDTEGAPVMDTSKMSAGQRDALELTEAARDAAQAEQGFAGGLFMGRFNLHGIAPYPQQDAEDRSKGDRFLEKLEAFLQEQVDPDEIDRTGEIPPEVIEGLASLGTFGIKISREHGGLGLSQTNYCRAGMMLGSYCGNLTALISAHQSIGVPQPLIMFGTEEQKRRFLPRVARGEISAFALTEPKVGSDPAKMETHAEPTEDGKHFVINGEKLWCTNGVKAGLIVVMAKTPSKMVNGKPRSQITAFIVDMHDPGVEVVTRCRFMGLKALYNAVIRFTNVKVPRENIVLEEGKGLRVALTTLNTGRLTLPAACAGLAKRCLEITTKWASERVQWGQPIGKHAAIAGKLASMAANTFAMEAMSFFAASIVDRDKKADVRLEAAMCKLWATERAWEIVDDTMQIRGGRGYETAASLKGRGEEPIAVERMMRDSRINLIFEGSSEIMRLFIAREALDPHLKIGAPVLNSQLAMKDRAKAAMGAAKFYAGWYPRQWIPEAFVFWDKKGEGTKVEWDSTLRKHVHYAERASKKLARTLFHAMALNGPKLEAKQLLLGRFVDIGAELFAITATCSRAQAMLASHEDKEGLLRLADYFCKEARLRVKGLFNAIRSNADRPGYSLARRALEGKYAWLTAGIVKNKPKPFTAEKTETAPPVAP